MKIEGEGGGGWFARELGLERKFLYLLLLVFEVIFESVELNSVILVSVL
jgi:hypothetical protein